MIFFIRLSRDIRNEIRTHEFFSAHNLQQIKSHFGISYDCKGVNLPKFAPTWKGHKLKIERMNKGHWGKIRAFFDLQTDEGFTIKGFKLVEGPTGYFVGFPSQKGNDEQYYDTVYADRELKDKVTQVAMKEYGGDIMTGGFESPAKFQSTATGVDAPADDTYSDDDIPF